MKNEQLLDDLKQFISATVSQSEERLSGRIDSVEADIKAVEQRLGQKLDDVVQAVGDAMEHANEQVDSRLDDHEHRLQRLERRHA